ncbi:MAG TPA: SigE family RNA polymerase sigma factor [Actinokineospora sp.]|jgi:RNA polymerase sigma-70 factor (sigma-E family)|nr:SigE family RNA polymerase sigma factor [Actinokineospora sp.]
MEFTEYMARGRPALTRFAMVLTCQGWLAEDVVSNVLCRAYEQWERISRMSEPHAYVRRMVVNEYLSWRRQLKRTSPRAEIEPRGLDDGADQRAERDAMIERLASLPRKQRAAVVLRYYVGLTDAEIAVELSCRVSTVRSQISRALATLRIDLTTDPRTLQETK